MKKLAVFLGIVFVGVVLNGFVFSDRFNQGPQEIRNYEIYFLDGEIERVRSYDLYLETTGCVHLVDNQRVPKYCFVKKIIVVD